MSTAKHTLQRLSSPSRRFSALFHLVGILCFRASFNYLQVYDNPLRKGVGGDFQFLTIIGLAMAMLTFVAGFIADLTLSSLLFDFKNILSVCSAPLQVLVSVLYWGLSAINKGLVVPPELVLNFIPDFGFHAAPAILLALDFLLLSPPWIVREYHAMAISLTIAFLYWRWVEYCFSRNGWYPYPIFEVLSTWQRVSLFTFSALLMTVSTMTLKWVYEKINGIVDFQKKAINPGKMD